MKKPLLLFFLLSLSLIGLSLWGLSVGTVVIPLSEVVGSLLQKEGASSNYILWQLRLPRVVLALLVGAGMSISGAIIQSIIRNPLASPKIIGINSGAGFAACFLVIIFPQVSIEYLPLAATLGGVIVASLIYWVAQVRRVSPAHLALIGIGVGFFFEAGIDYFLVTAEMHSVSSPLVWLTGSFWGRTWQHVSAIQLLIIGLSLVGWVLAYLLDLLYLGDESAAGLGLNVKRLRFIALAIATLLASVCVGVVGVMGFIGLMAPHFARRLFGGTHRWVIPGSALVGMNLVVLSEALGRAIAPPIEISAGILTALIGAPFFIYLMSRKNEESI